MNLDNTKRSDFVTCPRKYLNRNLRNIIGLKGSSALRYGIGFHACMEGFYSEIAKGGWNAGDKGIVAGAKLAQEEWNKETAKYDFSDDYRSLPNLLSAFIRYLEVFQADEGMMQIIEPEKVFRILMTPNSFEREMFPGILPFYFTGRMDLEVLLNGRPWIMEFKTTSRPLSIQVNSLHRSPQVIGYNYAARATSLLKEIPDGSLIAVHQISAYKSRTTGKWGNPKFDYTRSPQVYSNEDLANWRTGYMADAYTIQQAIDKNFFPMRLYSCYTYGACTYVGLCEQNAPIGEEILHNLKVDDDPWDVTKGSEHKLVVIDDSDDEYWAPIQKRISQ